MRASMESTGGWRNRPLGAAEGAQQLVPFHGRLVPIEEPDRAEEPDHEVIDLTNNSDEVVPDSELDFMGKEEEQAAEARRRVSGRRYHWFTTTQVVGAGGYD